MNQRVLLLVAGVGLLLLCSVPAGAVPVTAQEKNTTDVREISYGETVNGTFDEGDPSEFEYGGHYEPVTLEGKQGDVLTIELTSDRVPQFVVLGPDGNELRHGDTAGDGRVRLTDFVLLADGEYTIIASNPPASAPVEYTLSVQRNKTLDRVTDLRSVDSGTDILSRIDDGDPRSAQYDGHHEKITFEGTSGELATVTMTARGSPRLRLLGPDGNLLAREHGQGLVDYSELDHIRLPDNGTYTIIARTDRTATPTAYRFSLSLSDLRSRERQDIDSIKFGEQKTSTVDRTDPLTDQYRGYHEAVRFPGQAGDTVAIEAESFNLLQTILILEGPDGEELARGTGYGESDIPLSTLRKNGTHTIYVTGERAGGVFEYDLSLSWLGPVDREQRDLRNISYGEIARGTIDEGDPNSPRYRGLHEPVRFQGYTGERVTIEMGARQAPFLYLVGPDGTVITDSFESGQHSPTLSEVSLPADGEYVILATTNTQQTAIEYELAISARNVDTERRSVTNETIPLGGYHTQPDRTVAAATDEDSGESDGGSGDTDSADETENTDDGTAEKSTPRDDDTTDGPTEDGEGSDDGTADGSRDTDSADESGPGFGIVAGLVAVLTLTVTHGRRYG